MPIITSGYHPPHIFKNAHLATIYAGVLRRVKELTQTRERLYLPDSDFIDLDWSYCEANTNRVAILLHGLEGNAQRVYMQGSAIALLNAGYDVCAVNFRGCSGAPNTSYRSYHSGATEDLQAVIRQVLTSTKYNNVFLKGFSLGGNLLLKYLGEGHAIPSQVKGAVAISVPCQLDNSLDQLLRTKNVLYAARFKKNLLQKLRTKQQLFPHKISSDSIASIQTLKDFDDVYTSKAHGFTDAMDYYTQCSSRQFLPAITVPTLLINAANDSFLGKACYPINEAKHHQYLTLEIPKYGGHVGFYGKDNLTYTEQRAVYFFNSVLL